MPIKTAFLAYILLLVVGLSSCGNKGPLTLPDEDKKTQQQSD